VAIVLEEKRASFAVAKLTDYVFQGQEFIFPVRRAAVFLVNNMSEILFENQPLNALLLVCVKDLHQLVVDIPHRYLAPLVRLGIRTLIVLISLLLWLLLENQNGLGQDVHQPLNVLLDADYARR